MNYFQPMVLLKSQLDSSKTPEYWWLIKKPSLSWLVYYWRHYEKKARHLFQFSIWTKHTLKSSSNTKKNMSHFFFLNLFSHWLAFFQERIGRLFYLQIEEGFRKDILAESFSKTDLIVMTSSLTFLVVNKIFLLSEDEISWEHFRVYSRTILLRKSLKLFKKIP